MSFLLSRTEKGLLPLLAAMTALVVQPSSSTHSPLFPTHLHPQHFKTDTGMAAVAAANSNDTAGGAGGRELLLD